MKEFAVSAAAAAKGYHFTVPENLQPNVVALVKNLLQPINDATGWKNSINSGYRPRYVNNLVGGAPSSQHLTAEAADNMFYEVGADGKRKRWIPPHEVAAKVIELGLPFDQMILYPGFVHLSYSERRQRKQVLYNKSYTGKRL